MSPPSIALSIVRWTRIGIASESPVKTSAQAEPDRDQPPLGPPERVEVAQRRPELQIGRIDVLHARVGLLAAGVAGHAVGGTRAVTPAWLRQHGWRRHSRRATHRPERGSEAVGQRTLPAPSVETSPVTSISHLTDIILMSYSLTWTSTGTFTQSRPTSRRPLRSATRRRRRPASGSPRPSGVAPAPPPRRPHGRHARAQRPARSGHVEVRLAGPRTRTSSSSTTAATRQRPRRHPATTSAPASRSGCRRALKVQIEAVASSEGVSTNAWIVRALSRALEPRRDKSRSGQRLQGFAQS